jgi:hypothetical protein
MSSVGFGQSVSIGAIGGARVTDDLTGAGATAASKRYVVGPALEIGLPLGFGVEADALYRREGYQTGYGNFAYASFSDERANSWEFPLMLKYRLPIPVAKPFVELGYAPRWMHGSTAIDSQTFFPNTTPPVHSNLRANWPVSHGVVVGGGVQFGIGRLRLSPVVRYTHWNKAAIFGYYSDGPSWQSTQEQADVLLTIAWKVR